MKIQTRESTPAKPEQRTFVSRNPIRVRETLDKDGNQIDPVTKQIIKRNDEI